MKPNDLKTTNETIAAVSQPAPASEPVLPEVVVPVKTARNKLKDNKILFFGIPIMVVFIVIGGMMFFVLPTFQFYTKYQSEMKTLDKNSKIVDKSVSNLDSVFAQEQDLKSYDTTLSSYIPVEPKLGDIINLIQSKAKDFNLESKVGTNNGSSNTSVDNLAKKSQDDKALFQSLTSGEITFQQKSLNSDVEAVLLSIEVNVKGDCDSFLNFLADMQDVKPIVNLVFVEYSESQIVQGKPTVVALLRFESYALKLDTDNVKLVPSKQLKSEDSALTLDMREEKFEVDPAIAEKINSLSAQ